MSKKRKKCGRKKPKKRSVNKSIYKSNINKQNVKVNVNTGSAPSGTKYMNPPAYPNLTDINTTIKETVEELLKKHQQQTPTNIAVPHVNNPLNRFADTNQNTTSHILKENKQNLFEEYDDGSLINSDDYDEPLSIFLKPGEYTEGFFKSPLKNKEEETKTP